MLQLRFWWFYVWWVILLPWQVLHPSVHRSHIILGLCKMTRPGVCPLLWSLIVYPKNYSPLEHCRQTKYNIGPYLLMWVNMKTVEIVTRTPKAFYLLESRFTVYTCSIIEVCATRTVVSAVCLTITAWKKQTAGLYLHVKLSLNSILI